MQIDQNISSYVNINHNITRDHSTKIISNSMPKTAALPNLKVLQLGKLGAEMTNVTRDKNVQNTHFYQLMNESSPITLMLHKSLPLDKANYTTCSLQRGLLECQE